MECCAPVAIFVPTGGGGLLSATAAAVKQSRASNIRVIGVEPELENDTFRSFHTKQRVILEQSSESIADAVRLRTPGKLTLPLIEHFVDDVVTVTEREIAQTVIDVANNAHLLLEPSGGLAIAAARSFLARRSGNQTVVAIGSGGNAPIETLNKLAQLTDRD
jgi:threonine dehydratase